MSLTSIKNDECRIEKQLQILTEVGRYQLTKPGPGVNMPFIEDPYIRLQEWGANRRTNTIMIDSDLKGLTRNLNRDTKLYDKHTTQSSDKHYDLEQPFVQQSRATHPAWLVMMKENNRWDYLPLDPQAHLEKRFNHNLSSRIIEKDNYCPNS